MLYELDKSDVADVLALITSPQLSVRADQVPRVAQLQAKLSTIEPESGHVLEAALELERAKVDALEDECARSRKWIAELREELEAASMQGDELMRARDAALLELGLERSKVRKLMSSVPPSSSSE